ncbi:MAG: hypothetical protein JHD16_14140 [Solirubrobacteraceae bacterium]|nr:hypothetical protein [Solirubrobacteraceae bacterium]
MSAVQISTRDSLTAAEAEAIATAVALHHHRAAQAAASAGSGEVPISNWAREALLQGVHGHAPRTTAWGLPSWR